MGRITVGLMVLLWLGTAHATPCEQQDLDAGVAAGQLFFASHAQFDDGSNVRVKPQRPPANVRLAIAADQQDHNEWLAIEGDFDPAAKYVGLEINGYTMLTTPDQLYVCSRGTVLYDQMHDAKVFSVDRYGNRSDAVTRTVTAIGGQAERHFRCGQIVVVWMAAIFAAIVLFVVLLVGGIVFKPAPRTDAFEVVSPILAENVARVMATAKVVKFTVALVGCMGLWAFDHPFSAIFGIPFALVWAIDLIATRLVLRQFDSPIAALGKHGTWIYINGKKLYAPPRVWAKASSLPTAGLA
jgi:hypothetical protein